ncbi:MAG: hypothetical protein CMJ83_08240 [Planctomycetes bacterium]|nr:hypothetical protein [Planctomycetota bacterium]
MQRALLSALSGLRINQQYLDIIGNNLANTSTPGYKQNRVTFTELMGQTLRPASGPTSDTGGRNPSQIGNGAAIGSIDRNFAQGSLLSTGRNLDLGIQGDGFFVVSDGNENYFSRVGTFGLDADEYLVDLRSGYRAQNMLGGDIQIRLNTVIPAEETTNVDFQGNLPGVIEGPLAEELLTDAPFENHQPAVVIADSAEPYVVNNGDDLLIEVDNGAMENINMTGIATAGAATAAELAIAINDANIDGLTAVDNGGTLELRTNSTGSTSALFLSMSSGNQVGQAVFNASLGTTVLGSEATAVGLTNLNDLSANTRDYEAGDRIMLSGTLIDGAAVMGEFVYGDPAVNPQYHGTDLAAMVSRLNQVLLSTDPSNGATATFETDGTIKVVANSTGAANVTVLVQDVPSTDPLNPAGQTNWTTHFFRNTVQGADPDDYSVVTSIFDSTGQPHSLTLDFVRANDGTWTLTPSIDPIEGTILTPPITGIGFDQNGMLNQVPPSGIDIQWSTVPGTHTVNLDLGTAGVTDGLTQFGLAGSAIGLADGYTAGSLNSISVRADGVIEGFYTNGQIQDLDQLGVALFMNPIGLDGVGGSLYSMSSNSGQPMMVAPQSGSAGAIVAGSLEASNVDIAEEFVHLIEAQRSFQANARMISTTDEILAELVNLV